jgi:hypothetical protein
MKLKYIGSLTAIAASLMVAMPVEAAGLTRGSTVNLKNNIQGGALRIDPTTSGGIKFDFFGARTAGGAQQPRLNDQGVTLTSVTGDFANTNIAPRARIADLNLAATLNPNIFKLGSLPNFLTGLDVTGVTSNLRFNLERFVYNNTTGIGRFKGVFSDGTVGLGTFNLGAEITRPAGNPIVPNDFNYTVSVTAVPTPALLPGLIGMGLAALRKGKGEAEQPEEVKA